MAFYNSSSGPSNFVISFNRNPQQDFGIFAKGYWRAASYLAKHLLEKDHFADYEAYPIVFLYRQAFELYLKGFYYKAVLISALKSNAIVEVREIYKHRLIPLSLAFEKICKIHFPEDNDLAEEVRKIIQFAREFEEIDPISFSYRYPIDTQNNPSTRPHQVVNLFAMHHSMEQLLSELDSIELGMDIEKDLAVEVYEIYQQVNEMFSAANQLPEYDEHV